MARRRQQKIGARSRKSRGGHGVADTIATLHPVQARMLEGADDVDHEAGWSPYVHRAAAAAAAAAGAVTELGLEVADE